MTTDALAPPRFVSPAKALQNGFTLAWRGLVKIRKNPEQLVDVTIQPIVLLVVFVYLFGGAIAGGTGEYLQRLTPGLLIQNTLMASLSAGVALNTDVNKGVFDRFRAMPIARSAPLVGAVLADVARYLVAIGVLLVMATIMGYRVQTNPVSVLAAVAILVLAGLCFCWIAVFIGMLVPTPGAVQNIMLAIVFPLTFGSNVFVPSATMPSFLRTWSDISPVSQLADAMRGLLNGGPVVGPLLGGFAWMTGVVLVFFPLAMRAYRKRVT